MKKTSKAKKEEPTVGEIKFYKALKGHSKQVSAVLKCHLLAEYFIDQLILVSLPRGDLIINKGGSFANKLLIIKALNIISDKLATSIGNLNKVRNNCSHQQDYEITESDIDLIGRPFGKDHSDIKHEIKDKKKQLEQTLMRSIAYLEVTYLRMIKPPKKAK